MKLKKLERKVAFLIKFINHGDLMRQNCTKPANECKYNEFNQTHQFICSVCNEYIYYEQISVHACSGNCICHSCVNPNRLNEQCFLSDSEEND